MMKRTITALALALTGALGLASCSSGGEDPLASDGGSGGDTAGKIVVGSADFSESVLLADIYAGALRAKGVDATTKSRIGSREIYLKAIQDGSVQVLPEYTGALALYYDKSFAETDPEKVYEAAQKAVPADVTLLAKSAAEDNDAVVVTRETAGTLSAPTITALREKSGDMVLGGQPEFKTRPQGVPGLEQTYGVRFRDFRPLAGQALIQALRNNQVQAANIFTTDPSITQYGFVALQDDKKLFGAQNVVPLVSRAQAEKVRPALDAVSAKLTTAALTELLQKTDVEKKDSEEVAEDFLREAGFA